MKLGLRFLNYTPAFELVTKDIEPWKRIWGAVRVGDSWLFPAYFPFGMLVLSDLKVVAPRIELTEEAKETVALLHATHRRVAELNATFEKERDVELKLPPGFKFHVPPFPHQRYGIALGILNWRLFYLWEMRTGKTKTLIEVMRLLKAQGRFKRALVIGPPVVRGVWQGELELHTHGELTSTAWEPSEDDREELALRKDITLVTYAGARIERERALQAQLDIRIAIAEKRKVSDEETAAMTAALRNPLMEIDYDMIVGDESHYFGNWESSQTEAVIELSKKIPRRYALSGTAGDQPGKFYPQLHFLHPSIVSIDWETMKKRFFVMSQKNKHVVIGYKHLDQMNAMVDRVATRMKTADCVSLPERVIRDIKFDMGPAQKTRYNQMVRDMRATELPSVLQVYGLLPEQDTPKSELVDSWDVADADLIDPEPEVLFHIPHGGARVSKLLQTTSGFVMKGKDLSVCSGCPNMMTCVEERIKPYTRHCKVIQTPPPTQVIRDVENPKIELLEYLIDEFFEEDPTAKAIVWTSFIPEEDDITALFKRRGWEAAKIDTSSPQKVVDLQNRYRDDPKLKIVHSHVGSGIGLDLSPANLMIFYSLPWDPKQYQQALDRNGGSRQTRPRTVYRLMARGTIAEFVGETLSFKKQLSYTISEKIACATCDQQVRCAEEQNAPFRKGCIYQPEVARVTAPVTEVR